ncbi:helix-turn-helix transcriptional regulator, partial [Nocardioides sp.]|uniref:helix-turn-helix domain-containing protein n=1 Tax=Nocardioides sp. TaxID=35761 RepID=UPI002B265C1E
LERLGEAPRRRESEALAALTAGERRVAALALDGLTNREIAEQLVVSVKAVVGHLSKTYRKLGVRSRGALVAAIGRHDDD